MPVRVQQGGRADDREGGRAEPPPELGVHLVPHGARDGPAEKMWDAMGLVRVYTKKTGNKPDFDEPVVLADHRAGPR